MGNDDLVIHRSQTGCSADSASCKDLESAVFSCKIKLLFVKFTKILRKNIQRLYAIGHISTVISLCIEDTKMIVGTD